MTFTKGQWPHNICSGFIEYHKSESFGFFLSDSSHGIPTFAHVYNYPKQTEDIARRLVLCWNACVGLSDEQLKEVIQRVAEGTKV